MNNTVKIDLSYFYLVTNGNKDFEQKLLAGTVADVDRYINNLKNAWQSKDGTAIRKNAHFLIPLSAIIGVPAIQAWSKKIDQAFEDNKFHIEFEDTANNIFECWSNAVLQLKDIILGFNNYVSDKNSSLQ